MFVVVVRMVGDCYKWGKVVLADALEKQQKKSDSQELPINFQPTRESTQNNVCN
jgi:hypothetical protein